MKDKVWTSVLAIGAIGLFVFGPNWSGGLDGAQPLDNAVSDLAVRALAPSTPRAKVAAVLIQPGEAAKWPKNKALWGSQLAGVADRLNAQGAKTVAIVVPLDFETELDVLNELKKRSPKDSAKIDDLEKLSPGHAFRKLTDGYDSKILVASRLDDSEIGSQVGIPADSDGVVRDIPSYDPSGGPHTLAQRAAESECWDGGRILFHQTVPTLSLTEALSGKRKSDLNGALVFVGLSDGPGVRTPIANGEQWATVQAQAAAAILEKRVMWYDSTFGLRLLFTLASGVLPIGFVVMPRGWRLAAFVGSSLLLVVAMVAAMRLTHTYVPLVPPLLNHGLVLVAMMVGTLIISKFEEYEKAILNQTAAVRDHADKDGS